MTETVKCERCNGTGVIDTKLIFVCNVEEDFQMIPDCVLDKHDNSFCEVAAENEYTARWQCPHWVQHRVECEPRPEG